MTKTRTLQRKQRINTIQQSTQPTAAVQLATIAANMGIIQSPTHKVSTNKPANNNTIHTHHHTNSSTVPGSDISDLSYDSGSDICSSIYSDSDENSSCDLTTIQSTIHCTNNQCTHTHHPNTSHLHQHTHVTTQHIYSQSPAPISLPSGIPELDQQIQLLFDCCSRGIIEPAIQLIPHIPLQAIDDGFLIACEHNQLSIVNILLNRITSINTCNSKNENCLIIAARFGHKELCELLLKHNAALEHKSHDGITPLYAAVEFNQLHITELLIKQYNANIHVLDTQHNTLLHVAAHNGFSPIILLLFQYNISCNVLNDRDETPLEVAKNSETARILLENHIQHNYTPHSHMHHTHMTHNQNNNQQQYNHNTNNESKSPHIHNINTTASQQSHSHPHSHDFDTCPFRELPSGAASYLFWTAIGVGKDSFMFQNFGIYPFDRLNDTERIIILTEIAETMSGFKKNIQPNILNESSLYAVFALMKARLKLELQYTDTVDIQHHQHNNNINNTTNNNANNSIELNESHFVWRKRIIAAYEQVYNTNANLAGLSVECWKRTVWNTVINLLARSLFGDIFWLKKNIFLCSNILLRNQLILNNQNILHKNYNNYTLPNTSSIEIQLTFKKLITMSKTFLNDIERLNISSNTMNAINDTNNNTLMSQSINSIQRSNTGCFCQDCISELEVPLTFKLQFLEEAAEQRKRTQKNIANTTNNKNKSNKHKLMKSANSTDTVNDSDDMNNRNKLDHIILNYRSELIDYWNSIKIELKWNLTEMSTIELSNKITSNTHNWELLRAALESYAKYAWEEDILEISDDCITIADDMCDDGLIDMIVAILDSVELCRLDSQSSILSSCNIIELNDDEYDRKIRQLLENIVLAEFARKITASYLLQKQESYAEKIAYELEQELLAEEEQNNKQQQNSNKKNKKNKNKSKLHKSNTTTTSNKSMESSTINNNHNKAIDSSGTTDNDTESIIEDTIELPIPDNKIIPPVKSNIIKSIANMDTMTSVESTGSKSIESSTTPVSPVDEAVYEFVLDERPGAAFAASMLGKNNTTTTKTIIPTSSTTLPVNQLHSQYIDSVLLLCTRESAPSTNEQQLKLLGLQRQHTKHIRNCRPKQTALFLLNTTDKLLYGIYEANLITIERSKQIEFQCILEYTPLPYHDVEHIIDDKQRIRRLDQYTTQSIIERFITLQSNKSLPSIVMPSALTIPIAPINSILLLHPRSNTTQMNKSITSRVSRSTTIPVTTTSDATQSTVKKNGVTTLTPIMTAPPSVQAKYVSRQQRNKDSNSNKTDTSTQPSGTTPAPSAVSSTTAMAQQSINKPVQNVWKMRQEQSAAVSSPINNSNINATSNNKPTVINTTPSQPSLPSQHNGIISNNDQHTPLVSPSHNVTKLYKPVSRSTTPAVSNESVYNNNNSYNHNNNNNLKQSVVTPTIQYNGNMHTHQPIVSSSAEPLQSYNDVFNMKHINHVMENTIQPHTESYQPQPLQPSLPYNKYNGVNESYQHTIPSTQHSIPPSYSSNNNYTNNIRQSSPSSLNTNIGTTADIWGWKTNINDTMQHQSNAPTTLPVRQSSASDAWNTSNMNNTNDIWSNTSSQHNTWSSNTSTNNNITNTNGIKSVFNTSFINPSIWSNSDAPNKPMAQNNSYNKLNTQSNNIYTHPPHPTYDNNSIQYNGMQPSSHTPQSNDIHSTHQIIDTPPPIIDQNKKLLFTSNSSIW